MPCLNWPESNTIGVTTARRVNTIEPWLTLLAENELGLPTRIQTGGIFRDYEYSATGLPVMRKLDDGHLQYFKYGFDAQTGNLLMRQDAPNGQTEAFEYDNLNRLTRAGAWQFAYDDALSNIVSMDGARQFAYDALGNIVSMDGVGAMRYNNASRPYQVSSLSPTDGGARILLERAQTISYTCYSRPSRLNEGGRSASFTYNGNDQKPTVTVKDGSTTIPASEYTVSYKLCFPPWFWW